MIAEELPARADAGRAQHGVDDLGHPQVLVDARALATLRQPQARHDPQVVLDGARVHVVHFGEPHRRDDAVERALRRADAPGQRGALAQREPLQLLVRGGRDVGDDLERVGLAHPLVAVEALDAEVVVREGVNRQAEQRVVHRGGGEGATGALLHGDQGGALQLGDVVVAEVDDPHARAVERNPLRVAARPVGAEDRAGH